MSTGGVVALYENWRNTLDNALHFDASIKCRNLVDVWE
jgi:hypothetical protein